MCERRESSSSKLRLNFDIRFYQNKVQTIIYLTKLKMFESSFQHCQPALLFEARLKIMNIFILNDIIENK